MLQNALNSIVAAAKKLVDFLRDYPRLVSTADAFSLNYVQLYVGEVEDANHKVHPGISFQLPRSGWPINRAVAIDKAKAAEFIEFLEHLEHKRFPCSITFSRHDRDLHWEAREFQEKWHGGGGFSGYLQGNWLADHSNPAPVIITRESAARLRRYISDQYFTASDE